MSNAVWIRDSLHDLRRIARQEGLVESDRALRDAIVRVSLDAGIATHLRIRDLIDYQLDEEAASFVNAEDT